MIIYTNKHGVPDSLARAIIGHARENTGDHSVTGLIAPARIKQLVETGPDVEVDVMDLVPAFIGTSVHDRIAAFASDEDVAEVRLFMDRHGYKISGEPDLIVPSEKLLVDWKTDSVWKWIFKDFSDYEKQGNLYHLLATENGYTLDRIQFWGIIKDFSKTQKARSSGYPEYPIPMHEVPVWTQTEQLSYLDERLHEHSKTMPECSAEERWAKPDQWAVMKQGRKSAVKLYDTEAEARAHVAGADLKHSVQHRPGVNTRCEDYCPVSSICDQFKALTGAAVAAELPF